jgi:hypothetical protein
MSPQDSPSAPALESGLLALPYFFDRPFQRSAEASISAVESPMPHHVMAVKRGIRFYVISFCSIIPL